MKNIYQFALAGWRCGLRGHSFHGLAIFAMALIGVAYLAASFSPRQPQAVALDVGLSGIRFSLVLMTLFWIQELITKEVERRTVNFAISYPVDRGTYIVGRFLAIAALLCVTLVLLGLALRFSIGLAGGGYEQARPVALGGAYWLTLLGLWLDILVVASFAVMMASLSTVSILPLATGAAFAIAGKTLGPVLDFLVARGADGIDGMAERYSPLVLTIRWILPDLSRLDWRIWPMYNTLPDASQMLWSSLMALGYVTVMLSIAVEVFRRREFA